MLHPGDRQISRFIEHSPFSWIGFHLVGPSQSGPTHGSPQGPAWGRDSYLCLQDLGIGIVPIFSGRARSARDSEDWQAWLLVDADQAVALAGDLGLPPGTVIFLHVEGGRRLFKAQREYVAGWTDRVNALSRFRGGVYGNAGPVETLRAEGYTSPIWLVQWACGRGGCPSQSGDRSSVEKPCSPSLGLRLDPGCAIHQYAGDVYCSYGGVCLQVNLNLSADPDPSAPRAAAEGPSADAHN